MNRMITREIFDNFLKCKHKSYLKFMGVKGFISDYEKLLKISQSHFSQMATRKISDKSIKSEVISNVNLNYKNLKRGAQWIIKGKAKYGPFNLSLDGIKKEAGRSKNLRFHYIPILFDQSGKIFTYQRKLLALYGLVLEEIQGRLPVAGIIIYGQPLKTITLRLNSKNLKSRNLFEEIKRIQIGWEPPLILNNHCSICEYQKRCLELAKKEENLSLLGGMTEKQINKYNRRGIFTVTQLSYTYRARKINPSKTTPRHNFALQAQAIRDKRVLITGVPELKTETIRIFFLTSKEFQAILLIT